ncbi:unnamed protein product [Sphagnum jensenii]|uniref:Uncharacterized protein n=1 Tax=Sphagnum jensenii TaxID=128206 RepID=A0ABP1AQW3_9BRYO
MLISEMEDQLHTFDYIEGFVVMNNQDPINGLKSVCRSSCERHEQQHVTYSNSSFQRAVLLGSCRWLQPRRCWSGSREQSLEDVGSFALHPVAPVQHGRLLLQVSEPGPRCGSELACTATVGRAACRTLG